MNAIQRYKLAGDIADAQEQAEAEAKRQEAIEAVEYRAMVQEMVERSEIARMGHSTRELLEFNAQREAERKERVAALEAELRKLKGEPDPDKVTRSATPFTQEPIESLLHRATHIPGHEFMRRQAEMFDLEREAARSRQAQAEISRLERAVNGGTVTRHCDTEFTTY
jgi:hypothetical protein